MSLVTRIGLAIAVAVTLGIWGWGGVTADPLAVAVSALTAVAIAGIGIGARALRLGDLTVFSLQGLALVAAGALVVAVPKGPLALLGARDVFADGLRAIQVGTAPLPPNQGVTLALVLLAGALTVVADLLAITLERPGYAVIPLLGLFLVPALGLPDAIEFDQVVGFGIGVGLVLLAASPNQVAASARRRTIGVVAASGVVVGSLVATYVVGGMLPVTPSHSFGNDQLQMTNPSLDLKRNLTQGSTEPALTYTNDSSTGAYLRLATLTAFDANGFSLSPVRVSAGGFGAIPGLRNPAPQRKTSVEILDFDSEWLPVPYAPVTVRAPGTWGHASETLDVMAMARPDRKTATRGISYEVTSLDVRPTRDQIAGADSNLLTGRDDVTSVPPQLPARIRTLAQTVTNGAATTGAKALAIEAYLTSDRFTYSTAQAAGDSMRTLDDFLFGSRRGYCEQFAGSMVAMARVLGIPARLAVGFTPGTLTEDGVWVVTARDMHTWPEVWLDGWGWVAFEPTPASGVPSATTDPGAGEPAPTTSAEATDEPQPSIEPSDEPSAEVSPTAPPESGADAGGLDAGDMVGGLALLAIALAALGLPALLRVRRRTARLSDGQQPRLAALAAWDEVRDAASDLGVEWPQGSPRYAAEELAKALPDDAARGVQELALATERALYDRPDDYVGADAWGSTARTITHAWRERVSRGTRMLATWWPRSLWRR